MISQMNSKILVLLSVRLSTVIWSNTTESNMNRLLPMLRGTTNNCPG